MLKLECSSCGAPLDSNKMQCPYCKTKYSKDFSLFRQNGAQVNIGGNVKNSRIVVGNINTGGGVFVGGHVIVNGDFIGGTKRKIVIK